MPRAPNTPTVTLDSTGALPSDNTVVARVADSSLERAFAFTSTVFLYTLKNPNEIRIVWKQSSEQGVFSRHTAAVKRIVCVAAKSDVVVSFSAAELVCWHIGKKKTDPAVFFVTAPNFPPVRAVEWFVDHSTNSTALALIYGGTAGTLQCRDLLPMQGSGDLELSPPTGPEATVAVGDASLRAFPVTVSTEVSLIAVGSGRFAIAISPTSVVTCTSKNPSTPNWRPCTTPIAAMKLMPTSPVLLVATAGVVHIFDVEAEPRPLAILNASGPIVALACGGPRAAVFDGAGKAWLLAFDDIKPLTVRSAAYNTKKDDGDEDNPHAFAAVWIQNDTVLAFGISGANIGFTSLRSAPWKVVFGPPPPPAETSHVTPMALLQEAIRARTPGGAPPEASTSSSLSLRNPALTLAADTRDPIVALGAQTSAALSATFQGVTNVAENAKAIVASSAKSVVRDHGALLRVALEAHVSELQTIARTRGGPSAVSAAGPSDVSVIVDRLSQSIVGGMRDALDEATATAVDAIRPSLIKTVQRLVRDAHRERLDAAVKDVVEQFSKEADRAKRQHEATVDTFLTEFMQLYSTQTQQALAAATAAQEQLNAIVRSGVLEEVRELRQRVRELSAAAGAGVVPQAPPPSLESLVDQAIALVVANNATGALKMVTAASVGRHYADAAVAVRFARAAKERDVFETLLSDASVPPSVWSAFGVCLASSTSLEDVGISVSVLHSLLTDREDVAAEKALAFAVRRLAHDWKDAAGLNVDTKRSLRGLTKLLRTAD